MIRDVHPGSGFVLSRILDPDGSRGQIAQDPGSATLPERQDLDLYLKNQNEFNKVLYSIRASHFSI